MADMQRCVDGDVGKGLGGTGNGNDIDHDVIDVDQAQKRADRILQKISTDIMYKLEDRPPWYSTVILAFQHFLTMFSGCIAIPMILAPFLCIDNNIVIISKLIATLFFVSAVQTFLQTTFGIRLPMVQGACFTYILPLIPMMNIRGPCPSTDGANSTAVTPQDVEDEFRSRMQEVQGALFVASLVEILLGFGGIISILLRFIGPLTIAPTIGLIGLSFTGLAIEKCSGHWGVSCLTIVLILIMSQYMDRVKIPCMVYSAKRGCHVERFPIFRLFPIFLTVVISWVLCFILTATNVFPDDPNDPNYLVRTDAKSAGVAATPWFYFPYPGQWGAPTFTAGGILGMTSAAFASMVESIGDYYALAGISGAPKPPVHAVNRGIGMEGLGGVIAAFWGAGVSTTSFSTNIAVVGLTKVSSRFVVEVLCTYLLIFGVILKFGAVFASIPEPIIGGVVAITVGMVAAVGFGTLQYVDMNSARNLFIVGFSFLMGLAVPQYFEAYPDTVQTGNVTLDQILTVLLRTGVVLGGFIGCFLDNTIPGTPDERGLKRMQELQSGPEEENDDDDDENDDETDYELKEEVSRLVNACYDLPYGMSYIRNWSWTKYLPFCPTFQEFNFRCKRGYRRSPSSDQFETQV